MKKKVSLKKELNTYILLDRSGSMATKWRETLGAVNGYVETMLQDKIDHTITIAVFDSIAGMEFDVLRNKVKPTKFTPITDKEASPRGGTPLYDAIGKLITMAEIADQDRTMIVIMTDGEENQSREMSRQAAKAKIESCKDRGWQVVFLGADFDAVSQAATVGGMRASSLNMSAGNYSSTMNTVANARSMYATSGAAVSFTEDDRLVSLGKKPK